MGKASDSTPYSPFPTSYSPLPAPHSLTVAAPKRVLKEIEAAINSDRSLFRPWQRDNETSVFICEIISRPGRVHIPAALSERSSFSLYMIPPSPVSERASKEVVYRSRGRLW